MNLAISALRGGTSKTVTSLESLRSATRGFRAVPTRTASAQVEAYDDVVVDLPSPSEPIYRVSTRK